jgi:hypothetical protein
MIIPFGLWILLWIIPGSKQLIFIPNQKKYTLKGKGETPKTNNNGIATKTKPFQPT